MNTPEHDEKCPLCDGTRKVPCDACGGTGYEPNGVFGCPRCAGDRQVPCPCQEDPE